MTSTISNASPSVGTPLQLPRVVKAVRARAAMVPVVVQQRALRATAKYVELARQLFKRNFPMPTVAFDLRGRTAGQAFLTKNLIRYNAVLLVENLAEFEASTIPHEVAHLIAHQVYGSGIAGHGDEWKRVMRAFGIEPSRCHSYDVTNSAVGGVHEFTCKCGKSFPLGVKRSKAGYAGRLKCRACGTVIRPVGAPPDATGAPRVAVPVPRPAPSPRVAPRLPTSTAVPAVRPGFPLRPAPPAKPLPPVARPTPPKVTLRPATPAMLQYALSIASKLGIALQAEHTAHFEACADFINRYKSVGGAGTTATARTPSEKQLQFARDLARRKGLPLGADVLSDAIKMSAWLTAHK